MLSLGTCSSPGSLWLWEARAGRGAWRQEQLRGIEMESARDKGRAWRVSATIASVPAHNSPLLPKPLWVQAFFQLLLDRTVALKSSGLDETPFCPGQHTEKDTTQVLQAFMIFSRQLGHRSQHTATIKGQTINSIRQPA